MEDKWDRIISQCNFNVKNKYRARGAWLLDTDTGLKLLQDQNEAGAHFEFSNRVKECLTQGGMPLIDRAVMHGETSQGEKYVVYDWFRGEECDWRKERELVLAVKTLARLHKIGETILTQEEGACPSDLTGEMDRHNRELKRIYTYMKNKKKQNEFERFAITCFPEFYEDGKIALEMTQQLDYYINTKDKVTSICHGDYNYHNVLFTSKGVALTHFDKLAIDRPVMDLYYFMRKSLEKNNWDMEKGKAMIEGYIKERPLEKGEYQLLALLFLYPEKYWKVLNQYYNKKKSWMSARSIEKLIEIREQYSARKDFINLMQNL